MSSIRDIPELAARLREFAGDRDWEQFHTPKNLASALIVEAAELLEHFQWLTATESESLDESSRAKVEQELADVFIYLVRLSDRLGVDLLGAAARKMDLNAKKYPADKVRGSARKHDDRGRD